jgi:NAD(P)-dependent dehydrogenase (short-subunit alcohol dehydrogenase family)
MSDAEHAVVTGGASGIGAGVVERLQERGLAVTVFDADPAALERIESDDGRLGGVTVDVTDEDAVVRGFDAAVEARGPVNRLVTCAGIRGRMETALELDVEFFRRLVDVHVLGTLLTARDFARRLPDPLESPASVVTIGSIVGLKGGWTKQADYGTAKVAVAGLSQVLAVEWAERGIRVNIVAPGMTKTPMLESMEEDGYDFSYPRERTPMGRLAEVEEMARAIEWLLLDATYVTGVELPVDGGWTASGR